MTTLISAFLATGWMCGSINMLPEAATAFLPPMPIFMMVSNQNGSIQAKSKVLAVIQSNKVATTDFIWAGLWRGNEERILISGKWQEDRGTIEMRGNFSNDRYGNRQLVLRTNDYIGSTDRGVATLRCSEMGRRK